uniref:Nucleoside phosphorylase domain-containing protein n=1 Tax=Arcella intermedia TaxID=1963864 RepID=A0A6B2LCH8_9EUKA
MRATGDLKDANFPMDAEGRVYHLTLKRGELANRVLVVGDPQRAELLSVLFDDQSKVFKRISNRGFTTYTGTISNVPISIMAIGMGLAMIDFMIREARHIVDGPMVIIRLGTCGTPRDDIGIGTVVVSQNSAALTVNYEAFINGNSEKSHYNLSSMIPADKDVTEELYNNLKSNITGSPVALTDDVTTDTFYSSQGRIDDQFDDHNGTLIDQIVSRYASVGSIQMETFHLFHLARLSRGSIKAAACAIVLAQRRVNSFLDNDKKHHLEKTAGKACLDTLIHWNPSNPQLKL